jgi:hypothetical protein
MGEALLIPIREADSLQWKSSTFTGSARWGGG